MTTTTEPTYTKEIVWDRETRDYAMHLSGELVGFARSYVEADETLDALIFELLNPKPPTPAAQMCKLLDEYIEAKAEGRTADATRLKMLAVELEVAHPGTTDLVKESRKVAA